MKKMIIISVIVGILAALCVIAFWRGLVIRNYLITTNKFEPGQRVRAVLISDLHSHIHGSDQNPLIRRIRAQNPDIILLAGDIYDDVTPGRGTELFLAGIQDIAPIFYVSGNHEYWTWEIDRVKALFRSFGVTVLEDEYVEVMVNNIPLIIAGVCDPECSQHGNRGARPSMQDTFGHLSPDDGKFKILLSHRPELIRLHRQFPFDLVVSGHAHGGQVRIPFLLNGLYAPNQGFFPSYAGGLFKHDDLTHIVSRGASYNHPRLPRIFNPPEIVVIDIVGR